MHSRAALMLIACALTAAGCGPEREPRAADETVFKEQVRALERARTVEEEAEARKRELDRRIERDSEGNRP